MASLIWREGERSSFIWQRRQNELVGGGRDRRRRSGPGLRTGQRPGHRRRPQLRPLEASSSIISILLISLWHSQL